MYSFRRYKEIREVLKGGSQLDSKQEQIFLALLQSGKCNIHCFMQSLVSK